MKALVIVNESPWGGSLGVTALRLSRAMIDNGLPLAAVFFREEGVYQSLEGRAVDSGTPSLAKSWLELSSQQQIPLLLCSSASQRRLENAPVEGFREAGLAEVMELMSSCDRVVTF